MGFLSSKAPSSGENTIDDTEKNLNSSEKPQDVSEVTPQRPPISPEDEGIPEDLQAGVRGVEAAASVWTKWHLVAAYGM